MKIKIFLLSLVFIVRIFSSNEMPIQICNEQMDTLQGLWYNLSWDDSTRDDNELVKYIDPNGFLLAHRFCGFKWHKQGGFTIMSFIYQSRVGNIALKMIQTLPLDRKEPLPKNMPNPKNNILYNLLSNMSYSSKIIDPDTRERCNPMRYFFPEFKKTVDPRVWLPYLTDLEEQKENDYIQELLDDPQFSALFVWLKNR